MEFCPPPAFAPAVYFASTCWTTIHSCSGNDSTAQAARAELCRDYWYPVYAFIKFQGNDTHYAEDLARDFFAYILGRSWLERVDQSKGRFRSFLLGTLNHFLSDEASRKTARKRAGGYHHIPHDLRSEERLDPAYEGANGVPREIYEVEWATSLVVATLKQLEEEYEVAERALHYQHLKCYLKVEGALDSYQVVAAAIKISVSNVKVSVHRMRKRYAEILRERVAATIALPEDVADEVRYLFGVLAAA